MFAKNLSLASALALTIGFAALSSDQKVSQVDASTPEIYTKANTKANPKSRFGNFISAEHPTSGKASIVQENGIYFIEFEQNFKTSDNGPDLYVILHRSPNILKISKPPDYAIAEGDYALIAPLKSTNGKQRYEIPRYLQTDKYQSIAVWCRKYNATFGFAPLSQG